MIHKYAIFRDIFNVNYSEIEFYISVVPATQLSSIRRPFSGGIRSCWGSEEFGTDAESEFTGKASATDVGGVQERGGR